MAVLHLRLSKLHRWTEQTERKLLFLRACVWNKWSHPHFTIHKILYWQWWLTHVLPHSLNPLNDVIGLDKQMVGLPYMLACCDYLLVKLVFGFELRSDTHHLFSNNTTITMVVLRLFWLMNRWLYTNSAYVVWGCVLFHTTKYQIHHQSLTVKIYYDADDRRALSSSHPWKMMSTLMVEQLLPFYLLILWAAVLLSKSMVDAVRLCVHLDLNHFL